MAAVTRMHVTVVMKPRDPAALAAFARRVSTPGSPVYRSYLTPAQFGRRFGATTTQLRLVDASLRAHGLTPGPTGVNQLSVPVSGTAGQIEAAFSVSFRRIALTGGRRAVVANAAPALDRSIAGTVQAVVGLTSASAPRPLLVRPAAVRPAAVRPAALEGSRATAHVASAGATPCGEAHSAASAQRAYTADQIASGYRFSDLYASGAEGQSQTVAIYELESYDPADIYHYMACYGINTSLTPVLVDGGAGSGPGTGEAALDIENAVGLAPKANFLVYEGPNSGQDSPGSGPYDTFSAIITEDRAHVISVSWGECERLQGTANIEAESQLFQEAAAQGQSIVSATGDAGSEDCNETNGLPDTELAVDDPGSQPFVTGVGGTRLNSLGPPPSESVWNHPGTPTGQLVTEGGAGGGGISAAWSMPGFQSGAAGSVHVIGANSSGSSCGAVNGYCRQVPDVAADADPSTGYIIYWNGSGSDPTAPSGWQAVGGTSAAAPLWAALIADADSSSACHGSPVGFANPALYQAAGAGYATFLNDVTVGNNDLTGSHGGLYPAGAGYDMGSGLGTPNAGALGAALCADSLRVNNPGRQVSTLGRPVRLRVTTTALPGTKLTYDVSHLPPGLSFSKSTGVIHGRTKKIGTWLVGVAALDRSWGYRAAFFTWQVVGAPTVSQVVLSGVGAGRPKLALTVSAGRQAPPLKVISVRLSRGLSFGRAARSVTVTAKRGRRLRFSSRLVHGVLRITLASAASSIQINIRYATIRATARLAANVREHRSPAVTVTVETVDSSNHGVGVGARIKPRG